MTKIENRTASLRTEKKSRREVRFDHTFSLGGDQIESRNRSIGEFASKSECNSNRMIEINMNIMQTRELLAKDTPEGPDLLHYIFVS